MNKIEENLKEIQLNIKRAKEEAGREDEVLLVGVTKTFLVEVIEESIRLNILDIGENKAQEFREKYDIIKDRVNWHFIGHLQKNKVKYVVGKAKLIHSVDSYELAQEISAKALKLGLVQDCLIEVNISSEESKFGVKKDDIENLLDKISTLVNIKVRGLMTMAPNIEDETVVRKVFKELKELFENLKKLNINNIDMKYLSMGMSQDYRLAILEGANIIRVGSLLYKNR